MVGLFVNDYRALVRIVSQSCEQSSRNRFQRPVRSLSLASVSESREEGSRTMAPHGGNWPAHHVYSVLRKFAPKSTPQIILTAQKTLTINLDQMVRSG